jgi:hypothetical protein
MAVVSWKLRLLSTGFMAAFGLAMVMTSRSAAHMDGPVATETRAAEQTEVATLRQTVSWLETEVAVLSAPSATPTSEPTATIVPPRNAGERVPFADQWEVEVVGLTMAPTWEDEVANGQFARVQLLITNLAESRERFPFDSLTIRDASGRVFVPSRDIMLDIDAGWFVRFDPNIPTDAFIIFDVATDATGPYILESAEDPSFRILVTVEERG